jgi:hypothetical protein
MARRTVLLTTRALSGVPPSGGGAFMVIAFIPLLLGSYFIAADGLAQQNVNVRGTITAFDGKVISVKARDGRDVQVALPENVGVSTTKTIALSDIKPGTVLGVTTVKRPDGALVAIDVRPIPPTAPLGLSPHDLQPGSTMTNATLEGTVQSAGGQELMLNYKSGAVKVLVPPGTPMTQAVPGSRSDIKPGERIYVAARPAQDGKFTAVRVQVSKDGVNPSQ